MNLLDLYAAAYFAHAYPDHRWTDYESKGRDIEMFIEQAVNQLEKSAG